MLQILDFEGTAIFCWGRPCNLFSGHLQVHSVSSRQLSNHRFLVLFGYATFSDSMLNILTQK